MPNNQLNGTACRRPLVEALDVEWELEECNVFWGNDIKSSVYPMRQGIQPQILESVSRLVRLRISAKTATDFGLIPDS